MAQFTDEQINEIWNKGLQDSKFDPNLVRRDACGAWMIRSRYNDRKSPFGWEVDHIYPESKLKELEVPNELIDNIVNLRPLNWKNNVSKGSDYHITNQNQRLVLLKIQKVRILISILIVRMKKR